MAVYYRYVVRKYDWGNEDKHWKPLIEYANAHFLHVVNPTEEILYFSTTPERLLRALSILRISTIGFDILTTSELEPSTHYNIP